MSLEADRMTEHQEKILSVLEERFPDLPPREEIISALQETQFNTQGVNIEELMLKDLKEISDGEIKVAISTVYMTLEVITFGSDSPGVVLKLKSDLCQQRLDLRMYAA